MDESLWSDRNVAKYSYYPRLFYFMEVEGIHVASDDTLRSAPPVMVQSVKWSVCGACMVIERFTVRSQTASLLFR